MCTGFYIIASFILINIHTASMMGAAITVELFSAEEWSVTSQRGALQSDSCTQKEFALGRLHLSIALFAPLLAYYSHLFVVKVCLAGSATCLRVWLLTVLTQLVRLMTSLWYLRAFHHDPTRSESNGWRGCIERTSTRRSLCRAKTMCYARNILKTVVWKWIWRLDWCTVCISWNSRIRRRSFQRFFRMSDLLYPGSTRTSEWRRKRKARWAHIFISLSVFMPAYPMSQWVIAVAHS